MKRILTAITLLIAIGSCDKQTVTTSTFPKDAEVYLGGYSVKPKLPLTDSTYVISAVYWGGGNKVLVGSEDSSSYIAKIMVSNGAVTACGTSTRNKGNAATYWINSGSYYLNKIGTIATDIFLKDGITYMVGDTYDFTNLGVNDKQRIVYWKDGIEEEITDGTTYCAPNKIVVGGANNYVYISGNETINNFSQAFYWANGVRVYAQTQGQNPTYVYDMIVVGNDVLMAGQEFINGEYVPRVWRNGMQINFVGNNIKGIITCIKNIGSDYYYGGVEYFGIKSVARLWKNDVTIPLSSDGLAYSSYINDMEIVGNDIYLAGSTTTINSNYPNPAYWKNGTLNEAPITANRGGEVLSIAINK